MQFHSIIEAMRHRFPWQASRKILTSCDIPTGLGWEKTYDKLKGFVPSEEQLADLSKRYTEQILCGEKSVRYYTVTEEQMKKIRNTLSKIEIDVNEFSKSYPLPMPKNKLDKAKLEDSKVIGKEIYETGDALVYSSVRILETRQSLPKSEFPTEATNLLNEYSEVIGIKKIKSQSFDAVWIPKKGYNIGIRVDCPINLPSEVMPYAHEAVKKAFELDTGVKLAEPINLFPLIDKIYKKLNEGTVVEIAFNTPTASLKYEKMRRGNLCLRSEAYHKGGKNAINDKIELYKLGVQWPRKTPSKDSFFPELNLYSTSRMLGVPTPFLHEGTLRKCVGINDFNLIQEKIDYHLVSK